LLANPFFTRPPPTAAGYDEFGAKQLDAIAAPFLSQHPHDLVRTAVEVAAVTLADAYRNFVLPKHPDLKRVVLSGGGVRNATLVARIRDRLPGQSVESMPDELSDAKEAMAFAILGNETLSGRGGNIPSVTGARDFIPLGEIAL
jgi:anhydro-N-acetylmuramic acid kinase